MDIKVEAIVVTYNRPEILKKCLLSLLQQDRQYLKNIKIIVNSNDKETKNLINDYKNKYNFINDEYYDNVGPAGGFYYGLKSFLEGANNYAWLMDDDIILDDNCLESMVNYISDHNFLYPTIVKSDGEEVSSFGWWGALISKHIINAAGLPIKDLFYWAEDTEYLQYRIALVLETKPYRVKETKAIHLHYRSKNKPSWYYYYTVRNSLYYKKFIRGYLKKRKKRTFKAISGFLINIIINEDNKTRKIRSVFLGLIHGYTGKIGKLIDPLKNK